MSNETWNEMCEYAIKQQQEINELKAMVKRQGVALSTISDWGSLSVEFRVNYGSNGQRDYYRKVALDAHNKTPKQCLDEVKYDAVNLFFGELINQHGSYTDFHAGYTSKIRGEHDALSAGRRPDQRAVSGARRPPFCPEEEALPPHTKNFDG